MKRLLIALLAAIAPSHSPAPTVAYSVRLDAAHLDIADVTIRIAGAPASFQLAMKIHGEYNARYWRHIDELRIDDAGASVTRIDSTLWRVMLPSGHGVIHYRVRIQPPTDTPRRSWMPYARADGALINPPDFFLYLPQFPNVPVTVDLDIPRDWRISTALPASGAATHRTARNAMMLLDSPLLLGALRQWSFVEAGTIFHVVYWPLPSATPFDTAGLVDALHRIAHEAGAVFGNAPTREFYFLLQDGAGDALEHLSSVTLGQTSASLAATPRDYVKLSTITHEFFHTWNIVAIHPAGYNALSYRAPERTPGLWIGEGITLHYADVLPRRAGLIDTSASRLAHFTNLVQRYFGSPASMSVSPERASLAFGDAPRTNADAMASYYLQGELLGNVIDAMVRDSTGGRRGLDDIMRALYDRSQAPAYTGYTSREFETTTNAVCSCRLDALFANVVRGTTPIDVSPVAARLGFRLVLDSMPVIDSAGRPAADVRLSIDFGDESGALSLVLPNPATPWARAGLRTGDQLVSLNGVTVHSTREMQQALSSLHPGDEVPVEVRRNGQATRITVAVTGYSRPRVRFVDVANVTAGQRARRLDWAAGR